MTPKNFDKRSHAIATQVRKLMETSNLLSSRLETVSKVSFEHQRIEFQLEAREFALESLSDEFDALLTKQLAAIKREAEAAYGAL